MYPQGARMLKSLVTRALSTRLRRCSLRFLACGPSISPGIRVPHSDRYCDSTVGSFHQAAAHTRPETHPECAPALRDDPYAIVSCQEHRDHLMFEDPLRL
jgi:hypothetical protein